MIIHYEKLNNMFLVKMIVRGECKEEKSQNEIK